ncbi:hypothetical protein XFF6166_540028 [Xanthomonas citri pv. fuscans]|nr:hypothetical protein XFF6166_540028 [Xanthomonas citri pv. fuscans]SOO01087.1 hypothetical protein XFF6960_430018 [Xanthomonas citri pv. fuscans]SOO05638.1 hypothetical protein XFF7767_460028 [Xanthomonas citri pv. fuscans]SOO15305.1 hypothetical protein XFF7766_520028 [Xanthomonas citri pv. fuscans]SOO42482.1 hypothetical protein XFF1815_20028 [Xanthomonas citri pv. fuscans]
MFLVCTFEKNPRVVELFFDATSLPILKINILYLRQLTHH